MMFLMGVLLGYFVGVLTVRRDLRELRRGKDD